MELILKIAEWLLNRSDPMLIICFVGLAIWQHQTSRQVAKHLDPKNVNPHPQCPMHQKAYEALKETMDTHHEETRQDIQGLTERIDRVLEIAVKE